MERTNHPIWNEEFSFVVRCKKDSLKIFIKDSSKVRSHVVLSTVAIGLQRFEEGNTVDQWFRLAPVKVYAPVAGST
jgi:Ca2+-dependent lipid-binding protein